MPQKSVDMAGIFQAVTRSLAESQQALDQSDTYNHDHGSNMVETFQTITQALEKKKNSSDSAALSYAAKTLAKSSHSGSGKLYSQNLDQAARQFKGKSVDAQGALQLLQTLIGSSSAGESSGGDMLSTLLGGMMGGQGTSSQPAAGGNDMLGALLGEIGGQGAPSQPAASTGGEDLLGALLGGMGGQGGGSNAQQSGGIDLQDLLAGGMAFLQARQEGQSGMQALVQAFAAASGMGSSSHRNQSTQIVVESFLQALNAMGKR